jgi:hypothetical protein
MGSVSVVITCYKQSAFVAAAIESVLAQTYPAAEIIVVDDGSPDNTAAVVARYPTVQYVYQHNQNVSAARNNGLKHASGKYLAFLDGDDRLLPRALETGVKYLDTDPSLAFVAGKHRFICEAGLPLSVGEEQRHVTEDHYRELLRSNFIGCPATVMYRRDVLEAVGGFDTALNPTGDWDLYLRIAQRFPIHRHTEVVAEYRLHSGNTSRDLDLMLQCSIMVLSSQLRQIEGDKQAEALCKKGMKFQERMFRTEKMVAKLRTHARAKKWSAVTRDAASLLFYSPLVFTQHAQRKIRKVVNDHFL